jgi:thiamine biosynthesis lipoprotein
VNRYDQAFACMGTEVRVLIEDPVEDPAQAGAWARGYIEEAAARLTRFDADSELSRLNASPGAVHPASQLLRTAVAAALWAAEATRGLVDPTLLPAVCRAGYARSRTGQAPAALSDALATAPPRAPAAPHPAAPWKAVHVTRDAVTRPPGIELDTGGTTKGLVADAVAHRLAPYGAFFVDCGGDIRVGGRDRQLRTILVEHPFEDAVPGRIHVSDGAVATSGLGRRVWHRPDGSYAHHLIDPATGEPAWTGLIAATATAPTALEAEAVAKSAVLAGPAAARDLIGRHGGVLVHDDGRPEVIAPEGSA